MLIDDIARAAGLGPEDYEPYGRDKAKLVLGLAEQLEARTVGRPPARYIGVTAINPTPLGEGKTVTAIGLAMALCRRGHRAIVTLREPSLGPLFGIKGGGAGGGRATLEPADDINLHFTGDIHAVATATNLLAALVDNHVRRNLEPRLDPASLRIRRALDLCDRTLERITGGRVFSDPAAQRETGFDLAPAAEIMAILALATDLPDLRQRLGRIVVGERAAAPAGNPAGVSAGVSAGVPAGVSAGVSPAEFVTADELGFAGSLAVLMRDALRPNLVRTCEGTPALVHAGPFANIAHGNCSAIADRCAARLGDYVVTESGFGADCGAEKLFHIKCRSTGLWPSAMVLVCTVRALKFHSGQFVVRPGQPLPAELASENLAALNAGAVNLRAHLDLLAKFQVPVVVAINRFPGDSTAELGRIAELAREFGATDVAVSDTFAQGGEGALDLAAAIERASQPAARGQAARGKAARDNAARDNAARDKAARDKAETENPESGHPASDQAASDQAASDQAASDQAASGHPASGHPVSDQAASDQAASGQAASGQAASGPRYLYPLEMPIAGKLAVIAREVYGADGVALSAEAERQAEQLERLGYGSLPVCVAKTQYSLSHDPALLGRPTGFRVPIHELRLSAGAGFVYALAGEIRTMPGLPSRPAALRIDLDATGRPTGLR